MKTKPDAVVTNHGSIFAVDLETKRAKAWWSKNVNDGLEFGGRKIVEHRYIADIVRGMAHAGLRVI